MTSDLKLVDGTRTVSIQKSESLLDSVVLNIGCVTASVLKDLGLDEWRKYLCVEAGAVDDRVMVMSDGSEVDLEQLAAEEPLG